MIKIKQVVNTGLYREFPTKIYWLPVTYFLAFVLIMVVKIYANLNQFTALCAYLLILAISAKFIGIKRPYFFIAEMIDSDELKLTLRYHKQKARGRLLDVKIIGDNLVHRIADAEAERTISVRCDEIGKDLCLAIVDLLGNFRAADLEEFSKELESHDLKTKLCINTNDRSQVAQLYLGSQPSYQGVLLKLALLNVVLAIVLFII